MSGTPALVAFLDASLLYPALLRNLLMHLAVRDLFQARWSDRVHQEWIAALLRNRRAPRPLELLAVGAQSLDLRGVHRAFDIELCPAPTMRFADLLPLDGGPALEFDLLLRQGGALDLEIAELLGGRLCLIAR